MTIEQQENYSQGESIGFYLTGDTNTDLENNDFKVSVINPYGVAIEIAKSACTKIEDNKYYCEIANSVSKSIKTGQYKLEIYLGDTYTLIFKDNKFFYLEDSYSKRFVQ